MAEDSEMLKSMINVGAFISQICAALQIIPVPKQKLEELIDVLDNLDDVRDRATVQPHIQTLKTLIHNIMKYSVKPKGAQT